MYRSTFSAALMTLCLTACGVGDAPMTRALFCQEASQGECRSVSPACLVDESDCLTARLAVWTAIARDQESKGRLFDPANADACLAKVKAVYGVLANNLAIKAKDVRALNETCARVFHGGAEANEPCGDDSDCTGTWVCDKGRCGSLRQVGPGEGCANIGEYCAQGYTCSASSGVWMCVARAGIGAACSAESACLENLRCANGACADGLAIGLVCQKDEDCASGFCEPYAHKCGNDIRFAPETPACLAFQPSTTVQNPSGSDASVD
jgi:hypothetical protein